MLLQSDEEVKALLLERYSYIYPVPLLISHYLNQVDVFLYNCAYYLQPCKTVLSYGLYRASITKCGKSSLIDEIFSTDFTSNYKGNFETRAASFGFNMNKEKQSVFDIGRIDIQTPRNIDSYKQET